MTNKPQPQLGAIGTLAHVSRGYATDKQCKDAIARECELVEALARSYDAMLQMRGMLSKYTDISLRGGELEKTIEATALLLYAPCAESLLESMKKGRA